MRRNRSGLPKYCSWNWDRHGNKRVRFRKAGFSTYLYGVPYSDDFNSAYHAALDGVQAQKGEAGTVRTKPGSIAALLVRYYRSPEFKGLKPSTQTTYRGIFERFRAEHGNRLVKDLKREHVKLILGKMEDRKSAANNLKRLLAMLYDYGMDVGMVDSNPIRGMKGYRIKSKGFHTWTEAEIAQFESVHPVGSKARLAMTLLLYTDARGGDFVHLGWQHVTPEGRLRYTQEKTGTELQIKIHPVLSRILNAVPKTNMTFLVTKHGAGYTTKGFQNWFRDQCDIAGLPHCTAHGLRKAMIRRLSELGNSSKRVAAVSGHSTLKEIERYSEAADQVILADAAIDSLPETESEQELSNLEDGLDKVESK